VSVWLARVNRAPPEKVSAAANPSATTGTARVVNIRFRISTLLAFPLCAPVVALIRNWGMRRTVKHEVVRCEIIDTDDERRTRYFACNDRFGCDPSIVRHPSCVKFAPILRALATLFLEFTTMSDLPLPLRDATSPRLHSGYPRRPAILIV
jgi:hypothetical protein